MKTSQAIKADSSSEMPNLCYGLGIILEFTKQIIFLFDYSELKDTYIFLSIPLEN